MVLVPQASQLSRLECLQILLYLIGERLSRAVLRTQFPSCVAAQKNPLAAGAAVTRR